MVQFPWEKPEIQEVVEFFECVIVDCKPVEEAAR